jgi:hypothetical protein
MQNSESADHARPPTAVNSSSSQRIAIAVVITALIFGTGGYLLGLRTAQNLSQSNQEIFLSPSPIPSGKLSPSPLIPTRKPSPKPFVPKLFYPVPTTDPVLTANWKTYQSEKYRVTFRYPSNRYIDMYPYPPTMNGEYPYTDDIVLHTKQTSFEGNKNKESFNALWDYIISNGLIMFFFHDESSNDVFFSTSDKTLHELYSNANDFKDEGIETGGKMGRIISSLSDPKSRLENKTNHAINIDVPLKDKRHLIIGYIGTVITLDEFNQMLSTFKFTGQQ